MIFKPSFSTCAGVAIVYVAVVTAQTWLGNEGTDPTPAAAQIIAASGIAGSSASQTAHVFTTAHPNMTGDAWILAPRAPIRGLAEQYITAA